MIFCKRFLTESPYVSLLELLLTRHIPFRGYQSMELIKNEFANSALQFLEEDR
jgi:hypothetical protein